MSMELSFAPMEGVTYAAYRKVHRAFFSGADVYYAPFLAPDREGSFKLKYLRELLPENNEGVRLVPQVLVNAPEPLLAVAGKLRELGYEELNLNAGCPSGTVVAKHKGAGMLADPEALDGFLDRVFSSCPLRLSVKTRLGLNAAGEFPALLEVYKKYPLASLTVHARDRAGMYKSPVDQDSFALAAEGCPFPVIYNGNIFSVADRDSLLARFPRTDGIMVGRGAAANPALLRMLRGGRPPERQELRDFHAALWDAYLSGGLFGDFAVSRMKELWYYMIHLFPGSEKEYRRLTRARRPEDYLSAVQALFTDCDFNGTAAFPGTEA